MAQSEKETELKIVEEDQVTTCYNRLQASTSHNKETHREHQ